MTTRKLTALFLAVFATASHAQTAASLPYICDFEDATENANWTLENGTQTNQWFIGTAAANGGTNGLYISNDNGTTNAYTNNSTSYVYAYRSINFTAAGNHTISFNWKSYGEGNYDNLRAFLVPNAITLTAGDDNGWIAVSGVLNGQGSTWQSFSNKVNVPSAGTYKLVFFWKNDDSYGTNPPAAVDNISVSPYGISTSALTHFGYLVTPYTQPAAQTVTITNDGTAGTITITQPATPTNFTITSISPTTLAVGATATFTVRPKANLAVGTYSETINIAISGYNVPVVTVSANFRVMSSGWTQPTYYITGSSTSFSASKASTGGTPINTDATNKPIQDVINAIRTDADGVPVTIQFGNGTAALNIGSNYIEFNGTASPAWGPITLAGKITSAISYSNYGTICLENGASIASTADIANSSGAAVRNAGTGTVTISGGTVSRVYNKSTGKITVSGSAELSYIENDYGTIEITGGTVNYTGSNQAIFNKSTGTVTISGGTVSAITGTAVYNSSTGAVSISGSARVTSANTKATEGTIYLSSGSLEIAGGTVENTSAGGNAVYNNSGDILLSGDPIITGTIMKAGTGILSVDGSFEPASGKIYNLGFTNVNGVAVVGGASKSLFFSNPILINGIITNLSPQNDDLVFATTNGYALASNGTTYTITKGTGTYIGIQQAIDNIRTTANNTAVTIQFGDGTNVLDVGSDYITFNYSNSLSPTWSSPILLTGKITSATNSYSTISIYGASIISTADIANTASGAAVYISSGGGINISGGVVKAINNYAIIKGSSSTLNFTGGVVFACDTPVHILGGGYESSGNFVIMRADCSYEPTNTYTAFTSDNILKMPGTTTAQWLNKDGNAGIEYANGTNTGFIALSSVTVSKVHSTVTSWPTAAAITYGEALSTSVLSGGTTTPAGTFAWTAPATIPTVTNSGYSVTFTPTDAANYNTATQNVTVNITAKPVTITGITTNNKIYDGTTTATISGTASISSKVEDDVVTVTNGTASFDNKNVGTSKAVTFTGFSLSGTDASNYTLSAQPASVTANITAKPVTITGITASNKEYDGKTTATFTGTPAINEKVSGDAVTVANGTASFNNKSAGTNKPVTFIGFSLGGADAINYTLSAQPASTTANITPKPITITVTSETAESKVYDGTTTATIHGNVKITGEISGDIVTLKANASFSDKNVGTNKPITLYGFSLEGTEAGNYTVSNVNDPFNVKANITPKPITVTANASTKIYGTSDHSFTYSVEPALITGDNFSGSLSRTAGNNAGTYTINQGTLTAGNNYEINYTSANFTITPKPVTITGISTSNKEYDGTTTATVAGTPSFSGKVGNDDVTVTSGTASFANKNIGNGKTVTFTGFSLSGTDASNYTLSSQPASTTANITAKSVIITSISASDKEYDGTTTATVTGTATINGKIGSDNVTTTLGTASFNNKNVGTGKTVTFAKFALNGTDANNYTLSTQPANVTADITAKPITITGVTAISRTYNGSTAVELTGGTLSGILSGDAVGFTLETGIIDTPYAGSDKAVTTNITLTGTGAGNYTLTQPTGITVNIFAELASSSSSEFVPSSSSNISSSSAVSSSSSSEFVPSSSSSSYISSSSSEDVAPSSSSADDTPIFPNRENPKIGRIGVQTTPNSILLSNLPPNAKIEVYNLQGKRIHFTHSGNSQILKIQVQTGVYVIKIGTQTTRVAVR